MIKKVLICILILSAVLLNISMVQAMPNILSETAVLIDTKTGTILAEKNPNKKMYPASLTKIITAILAIENGNLKDIVTVDDKTPFEIDGSHVALEPGEILTLKDLLYALMLPSANDAAEVIAKHISGSTQEFVALMNKKAKEIGAVNTNFANPHGLHNENHYTTAYDLALITRYALQNETFKEICGTLKYEIKPTNKKTDTRYFANLNKLLCNTGSNQLYVDGKYTDTRYDGAYGVKTGYTPEAGNCLVAAVKRNDTDLIAVTMNGVSLEMYQDAHNLFNYGFNQYVSTTLIHKNTFVQNIKIDNGDSKEISVITENDLTALTQKGIIGNIDSKIIIDDIKLPLDKNTVVGKIEYLLDGKIIGSVNLISPIAVKSTLKESPQGSIILTIFKSISVLLLILVIALFALRAYNSVVVKLNRRKRRKKYKNI